MAEQLIRTVAVGGTGFEERWNVSMTEYRMTVNGKLETIDFQDLMVNVAENQALAIEKEVAPQAQRIKKRTARLKICGDAMAELAAFKFDTKNNSNPSANGDISDATQKILSELIGSNWGGPLARPGKSVSRSKSDVDSGNQFLKSESDKLNNEQQLAMSRMETLVQSRDQNFNMASTLMTHVGETRGSTIKSMG